MPAPEQEMSSMEADGRSGIDTLAGLMASVAIFISVLGATDFDFSIEGTHLDARPVRLSVAAVVLALVAAGLGGRHRRLAGAAVAIAGACWIIAMTVAVITQRPLF